MSAPFDPAAYRATLRAMTPAQRQAHIAESNAARLAEQVAAEAKRTAEREAYLQVRYSDATLTVNLDSSAPGIEREAHILLTVPENLRQAIVAEAHYLANVLPGYRWSDALYEARTHILAGRAVSSTAAALIQIQEV